MSNAIAGPGFLLKANGTTVAEVKDINGPEMTVDVVDVTNQDSPDNFEEIIPTLKHGGTSSFDLNFVPSDVTQTDLLGFLNARSLQSFTITVGAATVSFDGYVVKWGMKFPVANVAGAMVEIRVSGPVTIT